MISTFEQLKALVSPTLEHYKDDLNKHDRNVLEVYDGAFLYGWRTTGTDLIKMLPTFDAHKELYKERMMNDDEIIEDIQEHIIWITYPKERNRWFLHFDGNKFRKITCEQANSLYTAHVEKIILSRKQLTTSINF